MNTALYRGPVVHRRLTEPQNHFRYEVFGTLLDLDSLADTAGKLRFFSYNRFNLFSFHDRDHGPADGSSLRAWADTMTREAGLPRVDSWQLFSMPRVLGYTFNPLSVWYGTKGQHLTAVIAEVRNTFGGRHSYLIHNHGDALPTPVRDDHNKVFHVSPFQPMDLAYHFRLSPPGETFTTGIRCTRDAETVFIAAQHGVREALTDRHLIRLFFRLPWVTAKVMLLIHWQALKLWTRGARFYREPQPNAKESRS